MMDDFDPEMDGSFDRLRRQLAAWRDLEARLGDRPFGWAFEQHTAHLDPEDDLASLRAELAERGLQRDRRRNIQTEIKLLEDFQAELARPEQRERFQAIVDECDRILGELAIEMEQEVDTAADADALMEA